LFVYSKSATGSPLFAMSELSPVPISPRIGNRLDTQPDTETKQLVGVNLWREVRRYFRLNLWIIVNDYGA
jgi:hypothetical protein